MRIKRLELCGFKSFVEPTTLEFSPGVSGVVGPNGCGKSNIVDALRWLLGEQSALRLRGEAMEDVIFNGNAKGRAPAGMAEVSLLLENESPPDDGAELAEIYGAIRDLPEILVTRRYFRSGESEYEINRRPCRLKDITELFLGTGVGSKAYAIVEQGRVNQLVEARAEDVRLFIEEAAGTTLYRSRRLAAERKLERTRANLAIASERLQEKEKTIAWLRRMARRAEQYRALQEELRRVELQVVRRQYDRLVADVRTLEEERDALSARERDLAASVVTREEERVAARDALAAAEAELRERQEALYAVRGTRERAEARLEMLEREQREIVDRLGRIGREAEQAISGTAALVAELAEREAQLRTSESERATREGALADSLAAVQAEDARVAEIAGELETAKVEVQECLRGEAELRNEIAAAERLAGDRARRRDGIAAELARLGAELARLETEAGRLAGERALVEARLGESEAAASRAETDLAAARAERGRLAEAHRRASAVLAECESHLAALEEVERSYGRYHEGPRAVMRRHAASPNGVLNLVAEVLEAPPEYEKAVAAVLGERLQSVVVRTPEDARAAIEELKLEEAGRSSFVPL
ncbi:MAG: chromosome segregation protein, partial [Candidatus Binatota bacterium]|nr:chromosome segregation protein [Candidatus Binatota bacterium]